MTKSQTLLMGKNFIVPSGSGCLFGFGGKMVFAGKWFWRKDDIGGKMMLAGKWFWRENSFGGF
jgi:hypothetical protein